MAGVVRIVMWEGVHVAAFVGCAAGAFCRPGDGGGEAACHVRRRARCRLHGMCSWCFLPAWLWRTWSWARRRGWCGLKCGTSCSLALAWRVQLVLLAGVAEADVGLDVVAKVMGLVVYDGVHVAACVGRAAGSSFWRG